MIKKVLAVCASLALALGAVLGLSTAASAAGSDSPTPYTVDATGITLPAGDTFRDNGHVNINTSLPSAWNLHFESKCIDRTDHECAGKLHNDAQYIGKSFVPWSAFGLSGAFCVRWVQISHYNEHFGEGGQKPVCVMPPSEEEPPVTPEPPKDVVKPHIQDYIDCDGGAFVLDNLNSTVPVTYTVNGVDYVVPAHEAVHTPRADSVDRWFIITAEPGSKRWEFPAVLGEEFCPTPGEEQPPTEPETPVEPPVTPEEPTTPEEPVTPTEPTVPVDLPTPPAIDNPAAQPLDVIEPEVQERRAQQLAATGFEGGWVALALIALGVGSALVIRGKRTA